MVRTRTDENAMEPGTCGPRSGKKEARSLVPMLKPDLVWLRCDSGDHWRKVVVVVKVTSTVKMNKAFMEKDDK